MQPRQFNRSPLGPEEYPLMAEHGPGKYELTPLGRTTSTTSAKTTWTPSSGWQCNDLAQYAVPRYGRTSPKSRSPRSMRLLPLQSS